MNFSAEDQRTAAALLDSLRMISISSFRSELKLLIGDFVSSEPKDSISLLAMGEPSPKAQGYVDSTDLVRTGSDHVVKEITERVSAAENCSEDLSVEEMRAAKTKTLVLVTDYIGSGSQVMAVLNYLYQNVSIKSWHSGKRFRFVIACYAITPGALETLNRDRRISKVLWNEMGRTLTSLDMSEADQISFEDICTRYASNPKAAFGWRGSAGLTAFAHTLPNNTPLVLRQSKGPRGSTWSSLLPTNRAAGWSYEQERVLDDYVPPSTFGRVMNALGQARLGAISDRERGVLERSGFGLRSVQVLQLLACVRRGIRDKSQIADAIRLTSEEIDSTLARAMKNGLVSEDLQLTPPGYGFLRYSTTKLRKSDFDAYSSDTALYYPQKLR